MGRENFEGHSKERRSSPRSHAPPPDATTCMVDVVERFVQQREDLRAPLQRVAGLVGSCEGYKREVLSSVIHSAQTPILYGHNELSSTIAPVHIELNTVEAEHHDLKLCRVREPWSKERPSRDGPHRQVRRSLRIWGQSPRSI
jgi:hypothetical protein